MAQRARRVRRFLLIGAALLVGAFGAWPEAPTAVVQEVAEGPPKVRKRGGNPRPDGTRRGPLEPRPPALSPFDVGEASFTNARRLIGDGVLPPPHWVRVEEFANYPDYDDVVPRGDHRFGVTFEAAPHPWREGHHLLRIGLRTRAAAGPRPPVRLVLLVDVSPSMKEELDLAKEGLRSLVGALGPEDAVGIVTYADGVAEALPLTPTTRKPDILDAIGALSVGRSSPDGSAVDLAWAMLSGAGAVGIGSRILVISDGDPTVGSSPHDATLRDVAEHAEAGVVLSAVQFGARLDPWPGMEQLSDYGRGDYAFVDDAGEARRIFAEQLPAALHTAARDVQVQVDFGSSVSSHRIVGFEDAGDSEPAWREDRGHVGEEWAATALYDVVLGEAPTGDLATVRIRAASLGSVEEQTARMPMEWAHLEFADASRDFRVAVAMATFGEILRGAGPWVSLEEVAATLRAAHREGSGDAELARLIERAGSLTVRRYGALEEEGITVVGALYLGVDEEAVDTFVGWHAPALRACALPGAIVGDLRVKFVISKDGTVLDVVRKHGTIDDPAFEACVLARFREMRFQRPASGGIGIVTYPMTFFPTR